MSDPDFEMDDEPVLGEQRAHTTARQAVLATLNAYEDLGAFLDDPEFVFEVMALKQKLGLPTHREGHQ